MSFDPTQSSQIGIIMPMKNASPWIEECIESIFNQDFKNWELVIVDDFSEDDSFSIATAITNGNKRCRILKNTEPGIIPALRLAMKHTQALLISRMDADDFMPENKLSSLYKTLQGNENAIATGHVKYFSDSVISEGYLAYQHWLNERCRSNDHWHWVFRECVIASANWLTHRKNVVIQDNIYPEDYQLAFEWFNAKLSVKSCAQTTHLWREHPQRTSRNSADYQQEAFFRLKAKWFEKTALDQEKQLIVLGRNKKSKLFINELKKSKVVQLIGDKAELVDLNASSHQILSAVYPKEWERNQLIGFLKTKGFSLGLNFWFL